MGVGPGLPACLLPVSNTKSGTECQVNMYRCQSLGGMCVCSPLYSHYPVCS